MTTTEATSTGVGHETLHFLWSVASYTEGNERHGFLHQLQSYKRQKSLHQNPSLTSTGTEGYKTGSDETTDCKKGSQILSPSSVPSVTSAEKVRDTHTQGHWWNGDTT